MSVGRVWTLQVGSSFRNYVTFEFERKLKLENPTSFSATIKYYGDIQYFDTVTIFRDGVEEWVGYVENITTKWNSDGRYIDISGRDATVILWKKYTENFSNAADKTAGFFGEVNAVELLKFMLRCPSSDLGSNTVNKSGWGLKPESMQCIASRTAKGSPDFCRLRKRGFGWRNSGLDATPAAKTCDAVTQAGTWETQGSTPPYCNDPTNNNSMKSHQVDIDSTCLELSLEHLPANATAVNGLILRVYMNNDKSIWAWQKASGVVKIYKASENTWYSVLGWCFGAWTNGWHYHEADISNIIKSKADFDAIRVRFYSTSGDMSTYVGYTAVWVNYVTTGSQETNDFFEVYFPKQKVMGVYLESRMTGGEHPRWYRIVTKNEVNSPIAGVANGWTEVPAPPNNGLAENSDGTEIDFDCYIKNIEYNYYDWGATGDPLDMFDKKLSFSITSSMPSTKSFGIWNLSESLESRYSQKDNDVNFVSCWIQNIAGSIYFYADINEPSGGLGYILGSYATPLVLNTTYYIHMTKNTSGSGGLLKIELYSDSNYQNLLYSFSNYVPYLENLRYEYIGWCYGYGYDVQDIFDNAFDESDHNDWSNWTRHSSTDHPVKDDTPYVSAPHSCRLEVNAVYGNSYVEKEFSDADYTRLDWWFKHYSGPKSESFNLTLRPKEWQFRIMQANWTGYTAGGYSGNTYGMREDDDDTAGIAIDTESPTLAEMGDWVFDSLPSKYMAIKIPNTTSCKINIEARLYDGINGHATSMTVSVWVYKKSTDEWIGNLFTFTSTSWAEQNAELKKWGSAILQTVDDTNNAKFKIFYVSSVGGGSGKGGIRVTAVWITLSGTAYWGNTLIAKVFNKDVSGIGSPNGFAAKAMVGLKVIDEVDHPEQYHVYIAWWDDSYYHTTITDYHITTASWYHFFLYVEVALTTGRISLKTDNETTTIVEQTGLHNTNYGNPDCFTLCNHNQLSEMTGQITYIDSIGLDTSNINAHTVGTITSGNETFTELISEQDNSDPDDYFRDIIHSWSPVEIDNLRFEITRQTTGISWAVSQVYVYKATDDKFRIFLESGESDRFDTIPYAGGPFIKAWSFDSAYATRMFPMNIPQGRLIDIINLIVNHCVSGSVPYEWWLAQDSDNTFHFAQQKGSDLSGSVTFDKGVKLGASTRSQSVADTVQRIYVVGRGEGKTKEDVSKWVEPTTTTSNMDVVRTFYEDILSDSKQINNENEANLIGQVKIEEDSEPKEQITIRITKDTYTSMIYDVGDTVTVTDILTGISGTYEIYNISITVNEDGETIDMVLGCPDESINNELVELYKRLKQLEVADIIITDWTAEGSQTTKISQSKITAKFEKTAKNEEQDAPKDIADPAWDIDPAPTNTSHKDDDPAYYIYDHQMQFLNAGDYMQILGNNDDSIAYNGLKIAIKGALLSDSTDYKAIYLRRNPKLVIDFKLTEDSDMWANGDSFRIGFNDNSTVLTGSTLTNLGKGYYLLIKKVSGFFYCWLVYSEDGINEYYEGGILTTTDRPDLAIRMLSPNIKYRIELTIERTKNSDGVYANGITIAKITKLASPSDPAGTVSEEDFPDLAPTGIISVSNLSAFTVVPLWMFIYSKKATDKRARVTLYKYSSEWETVDNDAESGY